MMTAERYEAEYKALIHHGGFQPDHFDFVRGGRGVQRLEITMPIQGINAVYWYRVKIYGLDKFPESEPIVTPGTVLRDYWGNPMVEPSGASHILGMHNGETRLCIYRWWDPQSSLTKTAKRTGIWLAVYHKCHLQYGKEMQAYLSHRK